MSSLNNRSKSAAQPMRTHEGGKAHTPKPLIELRRAVLSCFLWEASFYESGNDLAARIVKLVDQIKTEDLCDLAIEARHDMNLRHVPLFLAVTMVENPKHRHAVRALIPKITHRPDDLTELLAIYWKGGKRSIANQIKKGIADKLNTFGEYQLAKYQNKGGIKLHDLFNLTHPKPKDKEQQLLWKQLLDGGLKAPDTWEVNLSAKGNTVEVWTRLLKENKLGAMALLRNLRNMEKVGVDVKLIKTALLSANYERVLPFRFIAAARQCPHLEPIIESVMFDKVASYPKLMGKTLVLVDVSASMMSQLSSKSDMNRLDAGSGLAMILKQICEESRVFAFNNYVYPMPNREGFALADAIYQQRGGGTYLGASIKALQDRHPDYDRLIVFTDEQSADAVPQPIYPASYMINVAGFKPTVSYGKWISVSGFSERIVDFISMVEDL